MDARTVTAEIERLAISEAASASAEKSITQGIEIGDPAEILDTPAESPEAAAEKPEGPHNPPGEAILKLLVTQAEIYFGDENITKDTFLLKHILKNKEGYVSLKLVASFRKVKKISKDWRDLAYAIKSLSQKLEINATGNKVRRRDPLPPHDVPQSSGDLSRRCVIATNVQLPATIEEVKQLFSACGQVVQVHILTPGNPMPTSLQRYFKQRPEVYAQTCAFVEYTTIKSALESLKHFEGSDWRGMKVYPCAMTPLEDVKAKARLLRAERRSVSESDAFASIGDRRMRKIHDDKKDNESSGSEYDSGPSSGKAKRGSAHQLQRKSHSRPIPVSSRFRNNSFTPGSSPDVRRRHCFDDSPLSSSPASACGSPWIAQRRIYTASESGSTGNLFAGVTILRDPMAPDGSKGFDTRRKKDHIN